ncbi:hypothetical protein FRC02_000273 [Tulasnella sp. 418]|nr:hypothetical protein FRC02_000273 [Tulasnella sp. 418]
MCCPDSTSAVELSCPACGTSLETLPISENTENPDHEKISDEHFRIPSTAPQSRSVSLEPADKPASKPKRRRSPSPGDDRPTRRRKGAVDLRARVGKHAARTLRICFRADVVFRVGLKHLTKTNWEIPEDKKDTDEYPEGPSSDLGLFFELVERIPRCIEKLQQDNDQGTYFSEITKAVERGADMARSDDCNGLKKEILWFLSDDYCTYDTSRKFKQNRGFNDEALGKLLCPPRLDWSDSSIRDQLKNGVILVGPREFPPFVYRDFTIDPEKKTEGLFQSDLLIKAARYIFIAPSATIDNSGASSRSTRPGNAALNDMRSVTIPTIAYITTLVRFALSSDTSFTIKGRVPRKGGFDYWSFYEGIIKTLRSPSMKNSTTIEIMELWNRRLWEPHTEQQDDEVHDDIAIILRHAEEAKRLAAQ